MEKLLKKQLLQIVRDYNLEVLIPNYHKKKKHELVNEMNKHLVLDESTNKFTRKQHSSIDIKQFAKKKKVEEKKDEVKAPEGRKLTPEEKERVLKKIADAKKKKEEESEVKEKTVELIDDKAVIISKSKSIKELLDNIKNNISKDSMKPYLPIIYETYDKIRDFQTKNVFKEIRKLRKEADEIEYAGDVTFDENPTLSKKNQTKLDNIEKIIDKYHDINEKFLETKHNLKDIYDTHKYIIENTKNFDNEIFKGMGMIHAHLINLSLPQLYDICKRYNIHNRIRDYSKLKKIDLINKMKPHLALENNKIVINPQNEKITLKRK